MKEPYLQFFPRDWVSDPALALCGFAARGLWIAIICLILMMSPKRGYLLKPNGAPPTLEELARLLHSSPAEIAPLLAELEEHGVFSRDEHGPIYCRRMVRDAERSEIYRGNAAKRWRSTANCTANSNAKQHATDHAISGDGDGDGDQREERGEGDSVDRAALAAIVEAWNRGVSGSAIPKAKAPSAATSARDRKLREAVKRFPQPAAWEGCARALAASPHHRGENDRRWTATLGWLLERGKGAALEEWVALGEAMARGEWPPSPVAPRANGEIRNPRPPALREIT